LHFLALLFRDGFAPHQLQTVDFLDDLLSFFGVLPFFIPVDPCAISAFGGLGGRLENEFRNVLARGAVDTAG